MKIWCRRIAQNMNKKFFCPEYLGQNFSNFFVHTLGNAMTSYFHSEISWPLLKVHIPFNFKENRSPVPPLTIFVCKSVIILNEDCLPHSTKENQISFFKKGLNFDFQTRKLHNFEPHKRAVFVNCVGVKAASRRKVKHFSPCPSLADRMPRMPHLYNILEQLALSACCLLCWSSLNWFMWFLGRATCQVMDHCFWTELSVCQSSLCGLALAISVLWYK